MKLKFTKQQTLRSLGEKMLLSDEDCGTQTNCKYSDSFIVEIKIFWLNFLSQKI